MRHTALLWRMHPLLLFWSLYIFGFIQSLRAIIRYLCQALTAQASPSQTTAKHPVSSHALAITLHAKDDNLQANCPLFSTVPAEIRTKIFELALAPSDDKSQPYNQHSYYFRPDFRYHRRVYTDLLLTCRRVYSECYLMPVKQNWFVAWCGRPPPKGSSGVFHYTWCMNEEQKRAMNNLHIFYQQICLENSWPQSATAEDVNPRVIQITLRHTDWWSWESGRMIELDPKQRNTAERYKTKMSLDEPFEIGSWGHAFCHFHGLKTFVLELETSMTKKNEMDLIVARTPTWQFVLGDGNTLILDESQTQVSSWTGSKLYHGHRGMFPVQVLSALHVEKIFLLRTSNKTERDSDDRISPCQNDLDCESLIP